MSKNLNLNIVDSHHKIFQGGISDVTVSGSMGGFTVLPGHAPLIALLKPGEIHYTTIDGVFESYFVSGGIVEVQPTLVTILADTMIRSDELDEKAATESIERAKQQVKKVEIGSPVYDELMQEMKMLKVLLDMSRITNQLRLKRY